MSDDSEDYDENDRMFNPDCYDPGEKLFDSEGEDDTELEDYDDVVNFLATNQKAITIRHLVANSVQSLERIAPSSELKNAAAKEWDKYIIRIVIDKNEKTLSIIDNGVGMTKEDLEWFGSSSSGRGLLSVADKVVVTTKHDHEGNGDEYVMELSPKEKRIVVATQKDKDLLYLGSTRGTKITMFLKQQQEDEAAKYLQEKTTYEVLVDRYFLNKIYYRVFVVGIDAEQVTKVGWLPHTKACYETTHRIGAPIDFIRANNKV